jgi:hypothetical protein
MGIEIGGLFGLIILVLDVLAIVKVINSAATTGTKVVWTVIILVLPIIGFIAWYLAGPKS